LQNAHLNDLFITQSRKWTTCILFRSDTMWSSYIYWCNKKRA